MGTCIHCVRLSCALQRVRLPFPGENQTAHADIQNASAPELWTVEVLPEKLKQETVSRDGLPAPPVGRGGWETFLSSAILCNCFHMYVL